MRQRMAQDVASNNVEDDIVKMCYYVQQKVPVQITEDFCYSTFLEIQKELVEEQKRENAARKRSGMGNGRLR